MRLQHLLLVLLVAAPAVLTSSCAGTEDNRGAKRGAAGGALVGLTMGALTGDASLAAKGAVMGAVSGGVAGSMDDLQHDRNKELNQTTADAIAGRPAGTAPQAPQQPQTWPLLDTVTGGWKCSIWGLDAEGNRVTATATFDASLKSTRAARFELASFESDAARGAGVSGHFDLGYSPDAGYEILTAFSTGNGENRWAGEKHGTENRYSFYHVSGDRSGGNRVELKTIGRDLLLVTTYARGADGNEVAVQEYRFTRG